MEDEDLRPDRVGSTYEQFHAQGQKVSWWPHQGYWFVAGYEEVVQAAKDDATFSSRHDIPNGSSPFKGVMVPPTPVEAIPIELEPGDHGLYRRLLTPRFTANGVKKMEADIRQLVGGLLDEKLPSGRIDLFHDLVKIVPASVTLDILGLPQDHVTEVADAVHKRGPNRFVLSKVWAEVIQQIIRAIADRRKEPTDDLISALANGSVDGEPISEATVMKMCLTMIIGGMSTTAKGALGALWYLGKNPDVRDRLNAERSEIPVAVDEFLRYFSPVPFLSRTATCDTVLGGQQIKKGDRLALGWGAANRDPDVFHNPNEIDVHRSPNRHIAMGIGAHFCLGAALGRLEIQIMIEEVLDRIPTYCLTDEDEFQASLTIRPQPMPATFPPSRPLADALV